MNVKMNLQVISAMTSSDWFWSINKSLVKEIWFETTFYLQYLLSNFNYFLEKKSENMKIIDWENYFFRTAKDIEDDTWLSRYQQDRNREKLEKLWVIKTKLAWVPAKTYFTIDTNKYISLFETSLQKTWKLDYKKLENKNSKNFETYNNNINNNNINNNNINNNILSKDNIIYKPKNNFDYSFVNEFLNKEHPIIKYQIEKDWLEVYLWKQYEVVDKLIKDWFTLEQIQLTLLFIKQDDFWKNNILTIKKLRQKNKDWVPYIVVILWKAKDFIEEKQNRTYQKTFLYGDWQNYVSN